jgi:hypothetical protein
MKVNVVSIDQSYSLASGAVTNFAVLELSSGKTLRVALSDEDTSALIAASTSDLGGEYTPEDEAEELGRLEADAYVARLDEITAEREAAKMSTADLDDVATTLNFDSDDERPNTPIDNPASPLSAEDDYREKPVYEHHVDEGVVEWEKLPDTQLPPSMKAILKKSNVNAFISVTELDELKAQILEHMKNKPKTGKVNWNEGARRGGKNPWANHRTVPRDDAGNPIPPGGIVEADPGESSDDDDGVGQL